MPTEPYVIVYRTPDAFEVGVRLEQPTFSDEAEIGRLHNFEETSAAATCVAGASQLVAAAAVAGCQDRFFQQTVQ